MKALLWIFTASEAALLLILTVEMFGAGLVKNWWAYIGMQFVTWVLLFATAGCLSDAETKKYSDKEEM